MITIQKYARVTSLEEAYTLNQAKNSKIIGGMLWVKTAKNAVGTAIDLSDLGLNTIEETDEEFSIGAMVTLRMIEQHEGLNSYTNGAVRDSVKDIVGVQFRNMATVGGSIWGRFGFSDLLSVFLSMDSYVELYKGGIVSLEEFSKMPYDNDILVRLIVKKSTGKFAYKAMRAQRTDFPVLTCALGVVNGEYRVAIGARPNKAIIIRDEKNILANGINEATIESFSNYVADTVPTDTNLRGSKEYRTHLARVLVARSLEELGGRS